MKNVKIPFDVFQKLCELAFASSCCTSEEDYKNIAWGLAELLPFFQDKQKAVTARSMYSAYKKASCPDTREMYRRIYLDYVGMPENCRTDEEGSPWAESEKQAQEQEELDKMLSSDDIPDQPTDSGYWD